MSHYQAYLKAVGTQDQKRNISAPVPSVTRKPATYSTMPNTITSPRDIYSPSIRDSTARLPHRTASPSLSARAPSPAPTASPSAQFAAAAASAARTGLSAHPPPTTHSPLAASTASSTTTSTYPLSTSTAAITTATAPSPAPSRPSASPSPSTSPSKITSAQISKALSHAVALLQNAITYHSKRPFSALLLAPDNTSILLSHFSISHIRHAESELARLASDHFSTEYLRECTLVSAWEPCAMCAGSVYWSGIGRVVYAASEETLRGLVGEGNEENLTMRLPCRVVLEAGQREFEIIGPVGEWEEKVVGVCREWWMGHGGGGGAGNGNQGTNGVEKVIGNGHAKAESVVTTWTGEESVLSSIGEDGEYKADLDIDWMR